MNFENLANRLKSLRLGTRLILVLYSVIVVYPMLWTIFQSLKTNREFFSNIYGLPEKLQFVNYVNAWEKAKIGSYFLNSVLVAAITILLIVLLSTTTSYCLARIKFRLNKPLTTIYVSGLLIPTMAAIIPLFLELKQFSMLDNRLTLVLLYTANSLPFSVFLLIAFFKTINTEIEEAATIDGCSLFTAFWKIMFPLAMPGIIVLSIIMFLNVWNEFTFAYVFISSDYKRTLQVALVNLTATQYQRTDWATLFAAIVIVMLPTVIMYLIFQRRIVENMTLGAIK